VKIGDLVRFNELGVEWYMNLCDFEDDDDEGFDQFLRFSVVGIVLSKVEIKGFLLPTSTQHRILWSYPRVYEEVDERYIEVINEDR
jgi:hypothetical protein